MINYRALDDFQKGFTIFLSSNRHFLKQLGHQTCKSLICSGNSGFRIDLDDLVICSCDINLKLSSLIKWRIQKSEETLMGNIRTEIMRISMQFIFNVFCMIISIEKNMVISLSNQCSQQISLFKYNDNLPLIHYIFFNKMNHFFGIVVFFAFHYYNLINCTIMSLFPEILYLYLAKNTKMQPNKAAMSLKMRASGNGFIGSKFTSLGIVGSGSYGEVFRVRHNETNKIYAVKIYKNIFVNRILALRTLREIMILRRINNERVIKIYDILPPSDINNFSTIAVVLQYLPFDLKRLCEKTITLKDHHIPKIIYQLLIGLKYLRNAKILHRDLKPQNILSDKDFNIKICDFGLARPSVNEPSFTQISKEVTDKHEISSQQSPMQGAFTPQPKKSVKQMTCHVVSRWYRAPQLILMQTKYDSSIEMWSVGCILGQLISEHEKNKKTDIIMKKRKPLFEGKACFPLSPPKKSQANLYKLKNGFPHSEDDQISKILQVIGSPTQEEVNFIEEDLASNYIKSLPKYPKKKASEIFEYCKPQWQDFLDKTLLFDPRKRMNIDEALNHPLFDEIRDEKDYDFKEEDDLDLFLPSDMPMEDIKSKLKQQILIYLNGVNMDEQK